MAQKPSECKLMIANGTAGVVCADADCVFWRSVDRLGMIDSHPGCAIQYFKLLDGGDPELGAWLLSVKRRLETTETTLGLHSCGTDW